MHKKAYVHSFFPSSAINKKDTSISAGEASLGQTLPLAFKRASTGTRSPRLPQGRDTPLSGPRVLLGSVSLPAGSSKETGDANNTQR